MSLLAPINPCRSEKIFIRTRDIGWLFADVLFFVLGIGGRECRNTSQGGHEHGVFEERGSGCSMVCLSIDVRDTTQKEKK